MNTKLVDFYSKEAPNSEGNWLEEIWAWPDSEWEYEHSFIQWMFPSTSESMFNADAPILDRETIALWNKSPPLKENLSISFERWLSFCGVEQTDSGLAIANFNNFVWPRFNHNWLRITRVLNSLTHLGLNKEAAEFRAALFKAHEDKSIVIGEETSRFWSSR
jgi:hypothetical protein